MTNQNDTQDEAERLAINKIAGDVNLLTKIHCLEIPEVALALKKAYRAGVAARGVILEIHKDRLAILSEREALREELNQSKRETQAAVHLCEQSRAEVERLKLRNGYLEERISDEHSDLRFVQEQLATEKQKAERFMELLREAIEFMKRPPAISTGDRAWHQHDVIDQIEKNIRDYSTASGDGSSK